MKASSWTKYVVFALFAAATPAVQAQTPLGSEVTYQGQLKGAGGLANGAFPMVFTLWDATTVINP